MRIIDKNTDYYDFYQNIYRDNTFTFDRRDSYPLTKREFADNFLLKIGKRRGKNEIYPNVILLQICYSFWLIELIITENDDFGWCRDYELKLLGSWQDYNSKRELIKLSSLKLNSYFLSNKSIFEQVRFGEYKIDKVFNNFRLRKDHKCETRTIPILKDIGIPNIVDAFEIYQALENYFVEEKANSERIEAIGTTNVDKITAHGFDAKNSFRNKQN